MKYYISDTHFGHANIIKYENRPFNSVEEMDRTIIEQWNKKVSNTDSVYILGDFSFYKDPVKNNQILEQLNGWKYLIIGNHDKFFLDKQGFNKQAFEWVKDYDMIKDSFFDEQNNLQDYHIALFHYPIQTWDRQHHGALHLYGHVHSNSNRAMKYDIPNSYNVGYDIWHEPVSLQEILQSKNTF